MQISRIDASFVKSFCSSELILLAIFAILALDLPASILGSKHFSTRGGSILIIYFMKLKEKIISDLKEAMKAGDALRRDTLRMLDSAIKNVEIEKKKREEGLSEEETFEVISRAVKQRQDSIRQFIDGGRPELAEKEREELDVLMLYMPEQLDEDAVRKVIKEAISSTEAKSASDMGKVMGIAMGKLKGQADGNKVRKIVSEELEKLC